MKIGIFLPNWIGDAVMATPALRAVRRHFRHAQILGIGRPAMADLLAGTSWIDDWIAFDPRSPETNLRSRSVVRRMRQCHLDLAILLTNSFRTALLAWLAGAKLRLGYNRYGRGWLLTDGLPVARESGRASLAGTIPTPMVDYYLALACHAGCPPESPRLELATSPEDERGAEQVLRQFYLRSDRLVVFNSSGAFGAAKLWPEAHFAALARRVASELDYDVLILCGPAERELASRIEQQANHRRVVSLARHPLSIGLSKACVRRAKLMVSTDSGPRHFAVAFDVPVVTLFGPTHPAWVFNPVARAIDLHLPLECFACQKRTCPLGHHRCMRELSVDRVFQSIVQELCRPVETAA